MTKTKEKFAWLPKVVWNMKSKHCRHTIIWLCWYWDTGEDKYKINFYRLSEDPNEPPMQYNRYLRTNTNKW